MRVNFRRQGTPSTLCRRHPAESGAGTLAQSLGAGTMACAAMPACPAVPKLQIRVG